MSLQDATKKIAESLLVHALESRRETCKGLITTSSASLGVYLTLLGLVLGSGKATAFINSYPCSAAAPVVLFIAAAGMYVCGYFHAPEASAEKILEMIGAAEPKDDDLLRALRATLRRRQVFLWAGNAAFWLAVCTGLYSVILAAK
jgi:hypothetical protein